MRDSKYGVHTAFLQVQREVVCLDLTWIHLTELHAFFKDTGARCSGTHRRIFHCPHGELVEVERV